MLARGTADIAGLAGLALDLAGLAAGRAIVATRPGERADAVIAFAYGAVRGTTGGPGERGKSGEPGKPDKQDGDE
jgi:hypothetical protein